MHLGGIRQRLDDSYLRRVPFALSSGTIFLYIDNDVSDVCVEEELSKADRQSGYPFDIS